MSSPESGLNQAFQTIAAGAVCGVIAVVISISYGNLLLPPHLNAHLPAVIGMAVFATAVTSAIAALTSSIRGVVPIAQDVPIIALAAVVAAIAADLGGTIPDAALFATIVAATFVAMMFSAVALFALGAFRLGELTRFIPYPVIAGFMAGTGWLILLGGVTVIIGKPATLDAVPGFAEPATALKLGLAVVFLGAVAVTQPRIPATFSLPLAVLVSVILFNVVAAVAGLSVESLRETGWLIRLPGRELPWPPISASDIALIDWHGLVPHLVAIPAIALFTALALLLNASGIELETGRDIDLNRELRSVGLQNLGAGAGGGLPGYATLALTLLAHRLGAANRATSLIVALCAVGALVFGDLVLSLVPVPVFGGVLVWLGGAQIYDRLVQSRRLIGWADYGIILVIFAVMVGIDFMLGVLVGVIAAVMLFVVQYSQIEVVRHVLRGSAYQSNVEASEARREALLKHGDAVLILRLQGYLFFGTSDRLRKDIHRRLAADGSPVRYLVIDFTRVSGLDSSTVQSFTRLAQTAADGGFILMLCGLSDSVRQSLERGGFVGDGGQVRLAADLEHGLEWCENALLAKVAPEALSAAALPVARILAEVTGDAVLAEALVPYLERIETPRGEKLVAQGAPAGDIYFIESGRAAVELEAPGRPDMRVATVGPGSIVGEVAFYLRRPRSASIVAEEALVAWRLPAASLDRLHADSPEAAIAFHRGMAAILADRLTATNRLVRIVAD